MADPAVAFPFLSTALIYFSPAKSPFYIVAVAGVIASRLVCEEMDSMLHWWIVSIPLFFVLIVSFLFSFSSKPEFKAKEHRDHLQFSRSAGISSALIAFAFSVREAEQFLPSFCICYFSCLLQSLLFLLYSYARSGFDESEANAVKLNYVQLVLITSTFLVGGCNCMVELAKNSLDLKEALESRDAARAEYEELPNDAPKWKIESGKETALRTQLVLDEKSGRAMRYAMTGGIFFLLWLGCILYWINYLRSVIHISFTMPGES